MSSLYNLEPQPTASCILYTTSGDISLELWAQQLPLTCRNFLQLCLDGYYDNTIFHRLVPGFILQGGDPTGTGNGGESIYDGGAYGEEFGIWPLEERKGRNAGTQGVGFKDEFHGRVKFNRRGLLGMANDSAKDSNGSQFFLTLDNTPELQGKNTLFGRVEGETIYNVAKMGEAEVGEGERPLYPTKITGVEILVNPFKDMERRTRKAEVVSEVVKEKKKKRKIGGKQLLSFGGDDGDEDVVPVAKKAKFDTRIMMDDEEPVVESKPKPKQKKPASKPTTRAFSVESSPEPTTNNALPNRPAKVQRDISSSPEPEPVKNVSSLLDRTNAQIAELKASMKRNVQTAPIPEKKKSALEQMIPSTSVRGRKRHPGGNTTTKEEQQTLDLLNAFKSKLDSAPPPKEPSKNAPAADSTTNKDEGADDEEAALCDLHFIANCQSCSKWDKESEEKDVDVGGTGWMAHALSFKEDKLGKDLSYRKKAEEEMVVIDPREKARTLKEEKKAQREARAGGTGREWDIARNDKLARSSALAGRGAK